MIDGHRKGGSHSLAKLEELTFRIEDGQEERLPKNRVIHWVTRAPG